jgi:hypothetical protein
MLHPTVEIIIDWGDDINPSISRIVINWSVSVVVDTYTIIELPPCNVWVLRLIRDESLFTIY